MSALVLYLRYQTAGAGRNRLAKRRRWTMPYFRPWRAPVSVKGFDVTLYYFILFAVNNVNFVFVFIYLGVRLLETPADV